MDRRSFISTVAGALLAAPLGAHAQPAEKVYRVGFLATGTFIQTYPDPNWDAFVQGLREARPDAGHARPHDGAGAGQLEEHDLFDLGLPARARPVPEMASGHEPRLVVVGPEVGGAGVGNVDGNERDTGLEILGGDGRRHGLVRLELDDEVHSFADEVLGIPERDLRLVPVVDDDELRPFPLGGAFQARSHLARERRVLALRAVAEAVALAALDR